ncbi:hypothetical protein LINGRAHAP2_LOCUS10152 [Linum grandiflorum]
MSSSASRAAAPQIPTVSNMINKCSCSNSEDGCKCLPGETKMIYHPDCLGDDQCYDIKHCGGNANPYCDGGVCKCPN